MDTVIIVCKHIERADMFQDLYVHFLARKDVKDLIKVEEARVPVIKFTMDDFEFDLAMARLPLSTIPDGEESTPSCWSTVDIASRPNHNLRKALPHLWICPDFNTDALPHSRAHTYLM